MQTKTEIESNTPEEAIVKIYQIFDAPELPFLCDEKRVSRILKVRITPIKDNLQHQELISDEIIID